MKWKGLCVLTAVCFGCLLWLAPRPPVVPDTSAAVPYVLWLGERNEVSRYSKSYEVTFPLSFKWKRDNHRRVTKTLWVTPSVTLLDHIVKSGEERVRIDTHTMLQAAIDETKDGTVDCVTVLLLGDDTVKPKASIEGGRGTSYHNLSVGDWAAVKAKVVYSPDGGGMSGNEELANGHYSVEWAPFKKHLATETDGG